MVSDGWFVVPRPCRWPSTSWQGVCNGYRKPIPLIVSRNGEERQRQGPGKRLSLSFCRMCPHGLPSSLHLLNFHYPHRAIDSTPSLHHLTFQRTQDVNHIENFQPQCTHPLSYRSPINVDIVAALSEALSSFIWLPFILKVVLQGVIIMVCTIILLHLFKDRCCYPLQ